MEKHAEYQPKKSNYEKCAWNNRARILDRWIRSSRQTPDSSRPFLSDELAAATRGFQFNPNLGWPSGVMPVEPNRSRRRNY